MKTNRNARADIIRPFLSAIIGFAITLTFTACGNHSMDEWEDLIFGNSSSSGRSNSSERSSSSEINWEDEREEGEPATDEDSSSSNVVVTSSSSSQRQSSSSSRIGSSSSSSQRQSSSSSRIGSSCEINGETVKIGEQVWMAENLNCNVAGSRCYDNKESNCEKYGRLYDWNTAMRACPSGWYLPSDADWDELTDYVGGWETAGTKLKATSGWNDYENRSGNGTDDYGFTALPGGNGKSSDGSSQNVGIIGTYWSASDSNANYAYTRLMGYYGEGTYRGNSHKSIFFSVRCIKGGDI